MKIVEFRLSMPGRGSWDGRWSGESRRFAIVREVADPIAAQCDGRTWSYRWSDGWIARVTARVVTTEEATAPSDGFAGYDWMVDSILRYGAIYADHERPGAVP